MGSPKGAAIHEHPVGNKGMIKKVGNTNINAKHLATCHCGSVELELDLPTVLSIRAVAIVRCVGARGPLWRRCLASTANVACLEGVNPFELGEVRTGDGVNHPADRQR